MKSTISKILGIAVTLTILASMLVTGTALPASAAVGTTAYGSVSAPSNAGNVLGGASYTGAAPFTGFAMNPVPSVDFMAATPDGTTLFAWDNTAKMFYTSTNAAVSWTARPYGATDLSALSVIQLLVSPNYATDKTVALVTTANVWISADAGLNFSAAPVPALEGGVINAADIGTYYADGAPSIIIGCTAGAGGAVVSNVLKFKLAAGSYAWTEIGALTGVNDFTVFEVMFSRAHTSDAEILVLTAGTAGAAGGGVPRLRSSFANGVFGNALAMPDPVASPWAADPTGATIVMGTDYNGFTAGQTLAIGIRGGTNPDVYRVTGRSSSVTGVALDCDLGGVGTNTNVNSIAINGPIASATVLVGLTTSATVYRATAFPTGTSVTFTASAKSPTGTSGCIVNWVGTSAFAAVSGIDGGVSASTNGALDFNQLSLINVGQVTAGKIDGMSITSLTAIDANNMLLLMANAKGGGYAAQQLWVTSNGGTAWMRVLVSNAAGPVVITCVSPSPNYATDKTFFVSQGTGGTATLMVYKTTDGGNTFTAMITSDKQTTIAAVDNTNFYYGGATGGTFYKFGRWASGTFPAGVTATVYSIAFNPKDATKATVAVGMSNGSVYESTNDGVTFTRKYTSGPGTANALVAYGPDGSLYAETATAIYRFQTTGWLSIQAIGAGNGLAVTKDGTLYASDSTVANGVWRSLNPTLGGITGVADCEFQALPATSVFVYPAPTYNYTLVGLSVVNSATDNTLYVVDNGALVTVSSTYGTSGYASRLLGFKDTFIIAPAVTAPADKAVLTTSTSATLTWPVYGSANGFAAVVNNASTFLGDLSGTIGVFAPATAPTSVPVTAMSEGTTYYWKLRATTVLVGATTSNLYSRWSTTRTFITALIKPNVITAQNPTQGGTDVPIDTTFTWPASAAVGTVTYEFVIAEELGNADKFAIIDDSATTVTNAYKLREALKYDTQYWWRVRAVSASSVSAWTTSFFTTAKEPAAVTETTPAVTQTIIVPTQPAVTPIVTVIPPEQKQVIPTYLLWAVIAVGAILVIAVIVLIVRTRRIS